MKFYKSLKEFSQETGAIVIEKPPITGSGQMRWPHWIRVADATMPNGEILHLAYEDCYGWKVSL